MIAINVMYRKRARKAVSYLCDGLLWNIMIPGNEHYFLWARK